MDREAVVRRLHASETIHVGAVTGGAAAVVADLLTVPGGSSSIAELIVPYSTKSLTEFLGRTPEQFCSERTALAMAAAALVRGRDLTKSDSKVCGFSVTASLVSDVPKRGQHRVHAAVQTDRGTWLASLTLEKGRRSRTEEDRAAADLVLQVLDWSAGGNWPESTEYGGEDRLVVRSRAASSDHAEVRFGSTSHVWSATPGRYAGLLSGSFDPRHRGHDRLRDAASEWLGGPVLFELPIQNADKPPLDDLTLESRLSQFDEPVLLTAAPTFLDKLRSVGPTTFVVGFDTAARILEQRFYRDVEVEDVLTMIHDLGGRFLVAARVDNGTLRTRADLSVPNGFDSLFQELPADRFREDISSTSLRRTN